VRCDAPTFVAEKVLTIARRFCEAFANWFCAAGMKWLLVLQRIAASMIGGMITRFA
jgi:hypothetical protein